MKNSPVFPIFLLSVSLQVILAVFLAGCSATPPAGSRAGESQVPFEDLVHGYRLNLPQAQPVVRLGVDPASLAEVMALVEPEHRALLEQVDLDRQAVVAAFWGTRPSGGYSITVRQISLEGEVVVVDVLLNESDPQAPRIEASTAPYHLVLVDRGLLPEAAPLQYQMTSAEQLLAQGTLP